MFYTAPAGIDEQEIMSNDAGGKKWKRSYTANTHQLNNDPSSSLTSRSIMAIRSKKTASLNVLFIGNSFTFRNDMPGLIAQLADDRDQSFLYEQIVAGGASLRTHWNAGKATELIKQNEYDFVVLQEQSTLPIKNAGRFHENVRLFNDVIVAAGSKVVLYMTWARRKAPETQANLTEAYQSIGKDLGALVAPAGVAWEKLLAEPDAPILHDKDNSHPSLAGSYLAACVLYATVFAESPVGIELEIKLSPEEQLRLQKAAWQVAKPKVKQKK